MTRNKSYILLILSSALLYSCNESDQNEVGIDSIIKVKSGIWAENDQIDSLSYNLISAHRYQDRYLSMINIQRFGESRFISIGVKGSECKLYQLYGRNFEKHQGLALNLEKCVAFLNDISVKLDEGQPDGQPCLDGDIIYIEAKFSSHSYHATNDGICSKYYNSIFSSIKSINA